VGLARPESFEGFGKLSLTNRKNYIQDDGVDMPQQKTKSEYSISFTPGFTNKDLGNGLVITESRLSWFPIGIRRTRNIHGYSGSQQKGYLPAILPSNVELDPVKRPRWFPNLSAKHKGTNSDDCSRDLVISSSHNIPQVIIAIVQVVYAAVTLYRSRGDQLSRYGYAAFGLTVLPYLLMSIVNLLGNLITPSYPTLFLVDSREHREFCNVGACVDSVVGRIKYDDNGERTMMFGRLKEAASSGNLDMRLDEVQWDPIGNKPIPKADQILKDPTFRLNENGDPKAADIYFPCYTQFSQKEGAQRWSAESSPYWLTIGTIILGIIPYTAIGVLTRFQPGTSSVLQRFFTMFWLTSGLVIGVLMPFFKLDWASFTSGVGLLIAGLTKSVGKKNSKETFEKQPFYIFIFLLLFASAAFGGFIVVGQMLIEYGTCIVF
jgi:hypothetical protein